MTKLIKKYESLYFGECGAVWPLRFGRFFLHYRFIVTDFSGHGRPPIPRLNSLIAWPLKNYLLFSIIGASIGAS